MADFYTGKEDWASVKAPERLDMFRALTQKKGRVEIRAMDLQGEWICPGFVDACKFQQNGAKFVNTEKIILPELQGSHIVRGIGVFFERKLCFFLLIGRFQLYDGYVIQFEPFAMHLDFGMEGENDGK